MQATHHNSHNMMSGLRKESLEHFNLTAESADLNMKNHIGNLVKTTKSTNGSGQQFESEMEDFLNLFKRYLETKNQTIDWDKIKSPSDDKIVRLENLKQSSHSKELAQKLCVLKLNGGLGTTMGCVGPKSAIEVREGSTFLDLSVKQIKVI